MKFRAFCLCLVVGIAKPQQTTTGKTAPTLASSGPRALAALAHAPVDARIASLEQRLRLAPGDTQLQSALISAYLQKLRESGDRVYLDSASKLADKMLEKDGGSLDALRFQNEIDLQRHDFRAVAERSRDMSKYAPSDPGIWGNLGDASMELGNYEDAKQAYLKMFALRPSLGSYNRLAYFAFVSGNSRQAIQLMKDAIDSGDPEPQNVAWCWAELGDMYFKSGALTDAGNAYQAALKWFPNLHRASAGLGKVNAAQGHWQAAIEYYLRAQSVVPLVEYAAALEDLFTATGQPAEAQKQSNLIDVIAKLGSVTNEKTNRNLALALVDHNRDFPTALRLVEAELPTRGDVYTWDAWAWVLYKNGRIAEARDASAKALSQATPEPLFYYHACKIALAAGDRGEAQTYSKNLLALNAKFEPLKSDITQEIVP